MNKDYYIKVVNEKLNEIKKIVPNAYICNLGGEVIYEKKIMNK